MKELYSIKKLNKIEPKRGRILLSEPFMLDPYFRRAVVLLTEHHEDGSVGFILNRATNMKINEVVKDFPKYNTTVFMGGPVARNTLHFIHTFGDILEGSVEIMDDLYWGGSFETLRMLIDTGQANDDNIKFFIGYSGWTTDQLDMELRENTWIVARGDVEHIMDTDTNNLWRTILKDMGKEYAMIANFPENHILN